ncbi:hypothetical protein [Actibacterium sp. XHP0104]|nr:hypothetical protein [Actibacterium sp. XHP0104]MCV2880921.1 hypothetical protein [Actibacterium sp. XHP0104]
MTLKPILTACVLLLSALGASAQCSDHPTCPEGTQMNEETRQCVPNSS